MADFDPATGIFAVPWWGAVALLALVIALAVLAVMRAGGGRTLAVIAQFSVVAIVLLLGWNFFDRLNMRDRVDERRALDSRVNELATRALMPGSALACLDAMAGEAVEDACERAIFASPEAVAAATSYVAARLTLLADATEFSRRHGGSYEDGIDNLRHSVELDRFGIAAQVLATRDGCTIDDCAALELLRDPNRIVANMKERAFDIHVGRNVANWLSRSPQVAGNPPAGAAVATAPAASVPAPQPAPAQQQAAATAVNFPSASTIPPVSIMNNEPGMPGQNGMESAAKPDAKSEAKGEVKSDPKADSKARRTSEKPASRRAASAPLQVAPTGAETAARGQ